ncbi:MAG: hypothetical protein IT258_12325 [Saprospiraceae bacterium]|nr:hypothetical protein [Saprospiraceae bacterium]
MTILEELKLQFKTNELDEWYQEYFNKGYKIGFELGFQKGYALKTKETVLSLIENFPDQPDEKIAKIAKVDEKYVQQVRLELSKKK